MMRLVPPSRESAMSRLGSGTIFVKPTNNVYTGLAFISMVASLVTLVYVFLRLRELGAF
jgi:hypothetical protein